VNSKVLTVIGVGTTSEGGFGSTRRSWKVDISHIDYETCKDIANPVMLYLPLCLSTVKIVAKATPVVLFFYRESPRSEGLDRCDDCELLTSHPVYCGGRLTETLKTIDIPE
jgi:hypothetical protein